MALPDWSTWHQMRIASIFQRTSIAAWLSGTLTRQKEWGVVGSRHNRQALSPPQTFLESLLCYTQASVIPVGIDQSRLIAQGKYLGHLWIFQGIPERLNLLPFLQSLATACLLY